MLETSGYLSRKMVDQAEIWSQYLNGLRVVGNACCHGFSEALRRRTQVQVAGIMV